MKNILTLILLLLSFSAFSQFDTLRATSAIINGAEILTTANAGASISNSIYSKPDIAKQSDAVGGDIMALSMFFSTEEASFYASSDKGLYLSLVPLLDSDTCIGAGVHFKSTAVYTATNFNGMALFWENETKDTLFRKGITLNDESAFSVSGSGYYSRMLFTDPVPTQKGAWYVAWIASSSDGNLPGYYIQGGAKTLSVSGSPLSYFIGDQTTIAEYYLVSDLTVSSSIKSMFLIK